MSWFRDPEPPIPPPPELLSDAHEERRIQKVAIMMVAQHQLNVEVVAPEDTWLLEYYVKAYWSDYDKSWHGNYWTGTLYVTGHPHALATLRLLKSPPIIEYAKVPT